MIVWCVPVHMFMCVMCVCVFMYICVEVRNWHQLSPSSSLVYFVKQSLPLRLELSDSARLAASKWQGSAVSTSLVLGL